MNFLLNEAGDMAKSCSIGILIMEDVCNAPSEKLKPLKLELEDRLRAKYLATRTELKALHPMDAYVLYNVTAISGDFMIADRLAAISSILRGPDLRTAITEHTNRVVYTAYAPSGVEEHLVYQHMNDVETFVRLFSQKSATCFSQVF